MPSNNNEAHFRFSILAVFLASAVFVVIAVQHFQVPGIVEGTARISARMSGWVAVPVLLFLGFRNWIRTSRTKSQWLNGLALSSMVLVALVWIGTLVTSFVSVVRPSGNHLFKGDPLCWLATLLYSTLLAGLLAFALTGKSRLLVLCSALLMWSALQSSIYI